MSAVALPLDGENQIMKGVGTYLTYKIQFSFQSRAALIVMEQEQKDTWRASNGTFIPSYWELKESCDIEGGCWVDFECDEPFQEEDIQRVRRNIAVLDKACAMMVKA